MYEYAFSDPLNLIDPRGSSAVGVTATDIRRAFRHFAPFERGEQAARRAREEGASPGVQDALQHCVASCETAKRHGWAFSTALGGLYEEFGILVPPPTTYGDLVMDLHNNAVGNRLADKTCDCEEACRRAASNGELITGWKGKGPTIPSVPPHVF